MASNSKGLEIFVWLIAIWVLIGLLVLGLDRVLGITSDEIYETLKLPVLMMGALLSTLAVVVLVKKGKIT